MSHSKMTKRGRSQYIEGWNPSAKRFINVCALCGARGYSPSIDEDGFVYNDEGRIADFEHRAIREELRRVLSPLSLDDDGLCEDCARIIKKPR